MSSVVNVGGLGSIGTFITGVAAVGTLIIAIRNGRRIKTGNQKINDFHDEVAQHLGMPSDNKETEQCH
jgi:hypothetical protein